MAAGSSIALALEEMKDFLEQEVDPDLDVLERWIDLIEAGA